MKITIGRDNRQVAVDANWPARLSALAKSLGSQASLIARLGTSSSSMARWMAGVSQPHPVTQQAIAGLEAQVGGQIPADPEWPGRAKAARLRLGLTQKEMAEALGIAFQSYNRFERGRVKTPMAATRKQIEELELIQAGAGRNNAGAYPDYVPAR